MIIMTPDLSVTGSRTFVYVSNAEDGTISIYRMLAGGDLQPQSTVITAEFLMPMATSGDGRMLYAASRAQPYPVLTCAIDTESGELELVASQNLPDSVPYISIDRSGKFLFSASYGGNIIAVNALDPNGRVGEQLQLINTPSNPHSIAVDHSNRFLFVPCLGADQILQFIFNYQSGELKANNPPAVQLDEIAGPRHFAISPDNRFVYVLSEFLAKVYVLVLDPETGLLTIIDAVDGLTKDCGLIPGTARRPKTLGKPAVAKAANAISAADIHLTPNGEYLYISERTGSTLSVFKVDKGSGRLKLLGIVPTVSQPRGFAIDLSGQFMVVAGERADHIAVYRIGSDGSLCAVGLYPCGRGANWVEILSYN